MLSFDLEQENLEKLIEEKREKLESNLTIQVEDDDKIYPLFRNYPNGTNDYYLRLKSNDFSKWKNQLRILFIDKTVFGDKYYKLLEVLGCKIIKHGKHQAHNYNLIISNDEDKVSELMCDTPVIYINCKPKSYVNKNNVLFYYDNKKQYKKYNYYFYANEMQHIYREKTADFIDAISKIKEMT